MKFASYAMLSACFALGTVAYAASTRVQFYSTVVFLVTSKISIMILGNCALVLTMIMGRVTKRIFLGSLRDTEVEIVWENSRYTITETCLALTIFREELSLRVVVMFTALLFCKTFHWLCDARVEHVEQAQETSRLTHIRIVALLVSLFTVDVGFATTSAYVTIKSGSPSVQLLFGFEYVVLCVAVIATFTRYCLSVIDIHFVQGRWYNKSLYELYLKLVQDGVLLFVYLIFFAIIFTYYGIPLHLLRQLYMSFKNLNDRVRHFIQFRRITANLYERFPNATEQDIEASDAVCIICREEMVAADGMGAPKKLPCGHIFHFYCLRNWLERQLTCPTCRADVLAAAAATARAEERPPQAPGAAAEQGADEGAAPAQSESPAEQRGQDETAATSEAAGSPVVSNQAGGSETTPSSSAAVADMPSETTRASPPAEDAEIRRLLLAAASTQRRENRTTDVNAGAPTSVGPTLASSSPKTPAASASIPSPQSGAGATASTTPPVTTASTTSNFGFSPFLLADNFGMTPPGNSVGGGVHATPYNSPAMALTEEQRLQEHLMVERTLQQQIEILQLQLQVYRAQVDAANATRAALEEQRKAERR